MNQKQCHACMHGNTCIQARSLACNDKAFCMWPLADLMLHGARLL